MHHSLRITLAAAVFALSACGGDGGGTPAPGGGGGSPASFFQQVQQVVGSGGGSETAEPQDVGGITATTSETDEPGTI